MKYRVDERLMAFVWRGDRGSWEQMARAEQYIRGYELPEFIVTFDGLTLPYGELGL